LEKAKGKTIILSLYGLNEAIDREWLAKRKVGLFFCLDKLLCLERQTPCVQLPALRAGS
jgi:hypothetical protein